MNNRTTIVLIVLFFAALSGLWLADLTKLPDRKARERAEPRVLPSLLETKPDELRRIEIEGGPKRLAFERRDGNRWQMVEPIHAAADPSLVETLALNLKTLEKSRSVGTLRDDPAKYGLAPPKRTIRLIGTDPKKPLAGLEVGSIDRDSRYVRPLGSEGIEVVESKGLAAVDLPPIRWRDRALVRMTTFIVESIEAKGPGRAVKLKRDGDYWHLLAPNVTGLADENRAEGLVAELTSLKVADGDDGFEADDVEDLAPYGLDVPSLSITLTPRSGQGDSQTIHLGKPAPRSEKGERYFARRDDQNNVVVVDAQLFKDLGRNPLDLHGRKLSDVAIPKVSAIRLTSGGGSVSVARSSKGWVRTAPLVDRADAPAVDDLLKRLDELQATALLDIKAVKDPQFDKPLAVLEVWQDTGAKESSASEPPPKLKLTIGRRDPVNKVMYAQVEGDPVVFAIPINFLDGVTFGPLAFRDRQLAAVSPSEIARLIIKQRTKAFVIEAAAAPRGATIAPSDFRLVDPIKAAVDPEALVRVLNLLSNLRADTLVMDRPESVEKYGLDKPSLVATWTTRREPQKAPLRTKEPEEVTLTVGKEAPGKPGARFARVSTSPILFTLAPEIVAAFEVEFRDRLVVSFDIHKADKIRIRWPSLSLEARPVADSSKADEPDWTPVDPPAGLELEAKKIKTLVKSLSRLLTFRFAQYDGPIGPETGLSPPKFAVEIDAEGSGRPLILKLGNRTPDGYLYATTENGPSGPVFLLPLSGWEPWMKTPKVGTKPPADTEPAPDAKK
jgi:hypothetical protein